MLSHGYSHQVSYFRNEWCQCFQSKSSWNKFYHWLLIFHVTTWISGRFLGQYFFSKKISRKVGLKLIVQILHLYTGQKISLHLRGLGSMRMRKYFEAQESRNCHFMWSQCAKISNMAAEHGTYSYQVGWDCSFNTPSELNINVTRKNIFKILKSLM